MRALAILLVLAGPLALVAACGDDAEVGPLTAAAERSAHEESAHWYLEMDVKTKRDGEFRIKGTARMTSDASRGRMTMTVALPGEKPMRMEIINIRDEFWMRSPALPLPRGKLWMHSVDRSVAPTTMTIRELLDLIRESGDVEEVGGERVRGRPTTHYKAKVSIDEVFERSPEETRERFREKFEQFEGKGYEFPIEVWIDDESLVRRMAMSLEYGGEHMKLETDILEYGVNVPAAPPSAAKVVEEDQLTG